MLRILFFLALVFALGLGFAWLADRPGDLVVTFGGYQYQVTLMVAAVIVVAIVVATMASWWLLRAIWASPHAVARYFRARRRDRGYQALSSGMIAAGAGDSVLARKKKKEAMKLISADQEPLIHLLDAQASLLEGDHEAARGKFEAMLADPEMRLLGLRGLYLEAQRLGDRQAARHYAGQAVEVAPQLGWAAEATLEEKAEEGDWSEALRLVETQKSTHQIPRETAERRKAVLLTAKAIDLLDADPSAAKTAALEANRLAPDLVPAAVTAARALFRLNNLRKGSKILEAIWRKEVHPEVADAYVHARPGDSTHDRLERARRLKTLRRNHVESALAMARAALDAGEFELARSEAQIALRLEPREGVYLLLADIEEVETGDQGKVRQWLARAVRAPRDPAWVADGVVSERWAPLSPVTGRLDAFEWRVPAERLGQVVEALEEEKPAPATPPVGALVPPLGAPDPEAPPQEPAGARPTQDVRRGPVMEAEEKPATPAATVPPPPKAPEKVVADDAPTATVAGDKPAGDRPPADKPAGEKPAGAAATDKPVEDKSATDKPVAQKPEEKPAPGVTPLVPDAQPVGPDEDDGEVHPPQPRLPDDPGVDPEDEKDKEPQGFRLF